MTVLNYSSWAFVLLLALIVYLSQPITTAAASSLVKNDPDCTLSSYKLTGNDNGHHCSFLSMPFAKAARFEPPQEQLAMPTDASFKQFTGMCPQKCVLPDGFCADKITEDCLNLNVYVPKHVMAVLNQKGADAPNYPVMVFLPGGGFSMGTASCDTYDGSELTKRDMILVTVNYRVGAFGFTVNQDMGIEGNMGILDQLAALRWIKQNIRNFGGDPSRVTVAGESAGAQSVAIHLVSKSSRGLFHQAIMQSPVFSIWMRTQSSANNLGKKLAKMVGCSTLECMQQVPLDKMVEIQEEAGKKFTLHALSHMSVLFLPYTPVVDGRILTDQPLKLIQEGKADPEVPVIMGTNTDEGRMFIDLAFSDPMKSSWMYRAVIAALFRMDLFKVLRRYPVKMSPSKDMRDLISMVATDYIFTAPTHLAARELSKLGHNVHWYEFAQPLDFGWGPRYSFCMHHACHGADVAFVFSPTTARQNFTKDETVLSNLMMDYWANFVKTGDPNQNNGNPEWKSYLPSGTPSPCMRLEGASSGMKDHWKEDMTSFWDKIGYTHLYTST